MVGYSGARYKKFSTHDQAAAFIHNATPPPSPPRHSSTPSLNTMMNYFNAPQIMVPRTTSAASTIIDLVDDEKEDKEIRHHHHHHSLTSNLLPKPMLSVAELIEQKRQQAIARKQMKAKERAAVASGPAQVQSSHLLPRACTATLTGFQSFIFFLSAGDIFEAPLFRRVTVGTSAKESQSYRQRARVPQSATWYYSIFPQRVNQSVDKFVLFSDTD